MTLDLGSPALNQAAEKLLAQGKAIEHSQSELVAQGGKALSKTDLAKHLATIVEQVEKTTKKKESTFFSKIKSIFTKAFKSEKLLREQKDQKDGYNGKDKAGVDSGDNKTKELSADLERAVSRLQSTSKIDSDQNDLAILEEMTEVMKLSSELASTKVGTFSAKPPPQVEKALIAVSAISLEFKHNSAASMGAAVAAQDLTVDTKSLQASTALDLNAQTGTVANQPEVQSKETKIEPIKEEKEPVVKKEPTAEVIPATKSSSMVAGFQQNASESIAPSKVPTTDAAKERKKKENEKFVDPKKYSTSKSKR